MKKQRNTTVITNLRLGALVIVLSLLAIQLMPHALGQRDRRGLDHKTFGTPSHAEGGNWTFTGSLNTARFVHTATLLPSGMVLVAGGQDGTLNAIASAELYHTVSGSWTATGRLNTARYQHTATLLPSGMVLGCRRTGWHFEPHCERRTVRHGQRELDSHGQP
jgi:hypothetical protein